MFYIKQYPTEREAKVLFGDTFSASSLQRKVKRHALFLATRLQKLLVDQWDRRYKHPRPPEVVEVFGNPLGCVDASPIYIERPDEKQHRLATYQGKYKAFVLKIQMCCTFQGVPLFLR